MGWVGGWMEEAEEEDRKRDGEAGLGLSLSLSFISVPLSPILFYSVAATDGCGGSAAPAAFVLLSLSGRVPRIHSHLAAFLPSWKKKETEGRRRRQR